MQRLGTVMPSCSRCLSEPGIVRFSGYPDAYCVTCALHIRKELMDEGSERDTWPYLVAAALAENEPK